MSFYKMSFYKMSLQNVFLQNVFFRNVVFSKCLLTPNSDEAEGDPALLEVAVGGDDVLASDRVDVRHRRDVQHEMSALENDVEIETRVQGATLFRRSSDCRIH
jgi:hypothetical protein